MKEKSLNANENKNGKTRFQKQEATSLKKRTGSLKKNSAWFTKSEKFGHKTTKPGHPKKKQGHKRIAGSLKKGAIGHVARHITVT